MEVIDTNYADALANGCQIEKQSKLWECQCINVNRQMKTIIVAS